MQCMICNLECDEAFLRRHLRCHKITFQEYVLKWKYDNVRPKCKCGCAGEPAWNVALKDFAEFVHGHHAWGRKKSDEEKQAIGTLNSVKMSEYMKANPLVAKQRNKQMLAALTPEVKQRAIDSVNKFWASNSEETKEARRKASEHAINLLEQGKIGPQAPFKTEWVRNPFTGKDEYMHSSWETAFLERCVQAGVPVTKAHDIRIGYTNEEGNPSTYIPDFITLPQFPTKIMFEVKGQVTENVVLKSKAAEEWCQTNGYEYVLVTSV